MRLTVCRKRPARRGAIAVLAGFLVVVMLAMVAFGVDIGYISLVRSQLQNAADAGATAAASGLIESPSVARIEAVAFSERNQAAAQGVTLLPNQDIVFGLWDPGTRTFRPVAGAGESTANAVQVTTRVSRDRGNGARLFFARILDHASADVDANAIAALASDLRGFNVPPSGDNLPLLPITLDTGTWRDAMDGRGPDDWSWDSGVDKRSESPDGVPEVNLYPEDGTGASGNRGLIEIGPSGGDVGTLRKQIRNGIKPSDLDYHGGSLELNSQGELRLSGEPGVKATLTNELASIVGETRIIPLFDEVSGSGSGATYTLTGFAGVRIMHVNLNDSPKQILAQPAYIYVHGGIPNTDGGSSSSRYIYSSPHLVR